MKTLNYHHLRYFREVALEKNLSKAALRLNVSQSALSIQIKQLEQRLGHALFERVGRTLVLTEVGHITLDHADRIFATGDELMATLTKSSTVMPPLSVGALSTLSRNFQIAFLRPALQRDDLEITLKSGNTSALMDGLKSLSLDVILTTELPVSDDSSQFAAQRIADQAIGLHGAPHRLNYKTLRELLENEPLIIPTDASIYAGFENLISRLGVKPRIAAKVDDMAMIRLLTREDAGIALSPAVVLADEITSGRLASAPFDLNISEPFYAVTMQRKYPHPMLEQLLSTQLLM